MERQLSRKSAEGTYNASILDSLSESMKRDSWISEFNSLIPRSYQLTDRSTILIDNLDSLREILHFFESLTDYGVAYIYIQVILEALRFDYLRRFNTRGNTGVIKTCVQATRSVMIGATSGIVGNLLSGQVSDGAVRPIFRKVRGSMSPETDFAWMGNAMMRRAKKIVDDVLLHRYNFDHYVKAEQHKGYYGDVPWNKSTSAFPVLFLDLKARYQASVLADPLLVGDQEDGDSFLYETDIVYDDLTKTVRVPAALRRQPVLYSDDVPLEYSLGTLGALVAKELARAATVPKNGEGVWTERERAALHKYKQCMDVLARSVLNETMGHVQENRTPDFYYWIQGARTAFKVLSAAYVGHRRAANWDSYWKSAQRTFFRRFCLLSCSADVVRGEQNSSRLHCFLPLLNMEEFSKAFECHKKSNVRSGNYCLME
ncbi:hypothetical protein HPB48_006271 [Haemaphysalis longicornis]|uniref:PARP alpha-helical domain-containing protein n=1 Tax=Haemaphysalis longicornis TaxID=44386 RepID=A0A9J6FWM7_HAELO|nr:hypothetical protein HPB48_006271 [Haemaphysalis longicornis]